MKRILMFILMLPLLIFLCIIFLATCLFAGTGQTVIAVTGSAGAAGPTCNTVTPAMQQALQDDYWQESASVLSQKLKIASSITVCKVSIYQKVGTTANCTISFWSGVGGSGTQYGTTSQSTSLNTNSAYHWTDYSWTSNPVVPNDAYMNTTCDAASTYWGMKNGSDSYEDVNYDNYYNTSTHYPGDFSFKIYIMQ